MRTPDVRTRLQRGARPERAARDRDPGPGRSSSWSAPRGPASRPWRPGSSTRARSSRRTTCGPRSAATPPISGRRGRRSRSSTARSARRLAAGGSSWSTRRTSSVRPRRDPCVGRRAAGAPTIAIAVLTDPSAGPRPECGPSRPDRPGRGRRPPPRPAVGAPRGRSRGGRRDPPAREGFAAAVIAVDERRRARASPTSRPRSAVRDPPERRAPGARPRRRCAGRRPRGRRQRGLLVGGPEDQHATATRRRRRRPRRRSRLPLQLAEPGEVLGPERDARLGGVGGVGRLDEPDGLDRGDGAAGAAPGSVIRVPPGQARQRPTRRRSGRWRPRP